MLSMVGAVLGTVVLVMGVIDHVRLKRLLATLEENNW